jgi:SHS family lactate transporter-like MFS transporter
MAIAAGVVASVPWWKEPTKDQWIAWWAAWMGWTLDDVYQVVGLFRIH